MTLNDLMREVMRLGFEDEIADSEGFLYSVRRALATVYTDLPVYGELSIYKARPPRAQRVSDFIHRAGAEEVIAAPRGAFSLFTDGVGTLTVRDGHGQVRHSFSARGQRLSLYLGEASELIFSGENTYSVYSIRLYPDMQGEDVRAIPRGVSEEVYVLSEIAADYLSPAGAPRDRRARPITGASVGSGVMRIPCEYEGEVRLTYKKKPPTVSQDEPERELDLPPEAMHLFPLLVGAYVWLDDDAEKAYYYMSLYREGMAALRGARMPSVCEAVTDTSGWAG